MIIFALLERDSHMTYVIFGAVVAGMTWIVARWGSRGAHYSAGEATYIIQPRGMLANRRTRMPVGLWIWEPERDHHWWSSDLYKMIGADFAEDAGIAMLLERVHKSDQTALIETLFRAQHEDGQGRCELRFHVKDQVRRLALEFSERPATKEHGRRVIGSMQDVTDQLTAVQVERVRAAREQRFEAALLKAMRSDEVLHALPDQAAKLLCSMLTRLLECRAASYWLFEKESEELLRMGHQPEDPRLASATRWKRSQVKERAEIFTSGTEENSLTMERVGPGLYAQTTTCLLVPSLASGEPIGTLRLERGPDAQWTDEEMRFAEEVSNLMAQVVMVAKNRQLEAQLRQSQKMESIGQLAGSIAHDFNNMLTSILGYSELLTKEIPSDSPWQSDLREILHSGERAKSLTKQLLTFSRLQPMDQVIVELDLVLTNLEKMLYLVLDDGVDLCIELSADPSFVHVDVALMELVILNLVLNARDSMPQGGTVFVRTSLAQPSTSSEDSKEVVLTVRDTGHGIPPDLIERVFEPFFTTKSRDKGTGLGLSTAYGIVKQSHGDLRLVSSSDQGTVFEIRLPLHTPDSQENQETTSTIDYNPRSADAVLIVEDDISVLRLATRTLREAGYQVLEASNGEQALEASQGFGGEISLLLSDVVMPGISGGEVADAISVNRPDIEVIFMSGFNEDARVRGAVAAHDARYLAKPFTQAELVALTCRALGERRARIGDETGRPSGNMHRK